MRHAEATSYSFLIRLWAEGVREDSGSVHWRGHITNLIDERRRYVETLDDIVAFMQQYLDVASGRAPSVTADTATDPDTHIEPPGPQR